MKTADDLLRELTTPLDWLGAELHRIHAERWVGATLLDDICEGAVWPAGKLLRPALVLESCAMVGGEPRDILVAALGVEYFHAASLVHDDIIDGGSTRRGRPSVPARFGDETALLAGDALVFQVFRACAECAGPAVPAERVLAAIGVLAAAGAELCRGQHAERELRGDVDAGLDAYCAVAASKTATLLVASCQVGVILGGGTPEQAAALSRFARCLGVAFQMADDMRPYLGGGADHGKDVLADVTCRAMTFPLVVARHELGLPARSVLARAFSAGTPPDEAYRLLAGMVADARVARAAVAIVDDWVDEATGALAVIPAGQSRERFARIVTSIRDHGAKAADATESDHRVEAG